MGVLCGSWGLGAGAASAQQRPDFRVGVEGRHERFSYHFDNPSSFDTAALVAHAFEQRYVADNVWLIASVRCTLGIRWEISAGATPARRRTGDDYDTFFDSDGTVWVSGTTGPISIHSWQLTMRGEVARRGAVSWFVGYRWREDRSDFGLGHKTVARDGVTVAAEDVTDPERTKSRLLEVLAGMALSRQIGQRWLLTAEGEIAPIALGRLLVQLPVKYPGEDLVYVAKGISMSGRLSVVYGRSGWRLEVSGDAGRTRGYGSMATLSRDLLAAGVTVGRSF